MLELVLEVLMEPGNVRAGSPHVERNQSRESQRLADMGGTDDAPCGAAQEGIFWAEMAVREKSARARHEE